MMFMEDLEEAFGAMESPLHSMKVLMSTLAAILTWLQLSLSPLPKTLSVAWVSFESKSHLACCALCALCAPNPNSTLTISPNSCIPLALTCLLTWSEAAKVAFESSSESP